MDSLVITITTVNGATYDIRVDAHPALHDYIPSVIGRGVWVDERTFIPPHAIIKATIAGEVALEFPILWPDRL